MTARDWLSLASVLTVVIVPQTVQFPEPAQRTMLVSGSVTIANQPEVRVINTPDVNITNAPTLDALQAGDWSVSLVGRPSSSRVRPISSRGSALTEPCGIACSN